MNLKKKNWIVALCSIIILLCFCLIYKGLSTFSYPKGSDRTFLILGIMVFSKINKKFIGKYTRRLDRIFIYITIPVIIFTSFVLFQKMQIKNAKKEMQSIIENSIKGQTCEKRHYNKITYGELTPFLQIMNDSQHIKLEKEKKYLNGIYEIYNMLNSESLSDKQSRDENKKKLDILLQGVEKYREWIHSEMILIEEKIKNLGYGNKTLQAFHNSSKISLSIMNESMDVYGDLIISIKKIIEFIEKHQKNMTLINDSIEWNNEMVREKFAHNFESIINSIDKIVAIEEKQIEYQQQLLKKINN